MQKLQGHDGTPVKIPTTTEKRLKINRPVCPCLPLSDVEEGELRQQVPES